MTSSIYETLSTVSKYLFKSLFYILNIHLNLFQFLDYEDDPLNFRILSFMVLIHLELTNCCNSEPLHITNCLSSYLDSGLTEY